jgi:hypothetical protein
MPAARVASDDSQFLKTGDQAHHIPPAQGSGVEALVRPHMNLHDAGNFYFISIREPIYVFNICFICL